MTIDISYEAEEKLHIPYRRIIENVVCGCLDAEKCPYEAEVSVTITDGPAIRELNREYRENDSATDVLSFPLVDFSSPADYDGACTEECFNPETGELVLGDIVLNVERIKSQAVEYGHTQTRELAFLVAHSMLHLLGYDHMEEEEREVMEQRQRDILDGIGYRRQRG